MFLAKLFSEMTELIDPFRTAVPFQEQTTWNLTGLALSPNRDCGTKNEEIVAIETPVFVLEINLFLCTEAAMGVSINVCTLFFFS